MSKPSIVINKTDHDRLTTLANGLLDRKPEMAEGLLNELERARVVEKGASLQGTVQMGATVEYKTNDGHDRIVTLVYPAEADISQGKVSILTPIGTALLGLKAGQSIDWVANDGRTHQLTIVSVTWRVVVAGYSPLHRRGRAAASPIMPVR
jgi:regulator of nucleoside diphosphate kinase